MALIKNQYKRLCLIDTALRSLHEPGKETIKKFVRERMTGDESNGYICDSTIEKDLKLMRVEFDAPIVFRKGVYVNIVQTGFYYYSDPEYNFWRSFLAYWDMYLDFPTPMKKMLYETYSK